MILTKLLVRQITLLTVTSSVTLAYYYKYGHAAKNYSPSSTSWQFFGAPQKQQHLANRIRKSAWSYGGAAGSYGGSGYVRPTPGSPLGPALAACFRRFANCLVVGAAPSERRTGRTPAECAAICLRLANDIAFPCRAFVYDRHTRLCDLYPHTGRQRGAQLWSYSYSDYYETIVGECSSMVMTTATPITTTASVTPTASMTPTAPITPTATTPPPTGRCDDREEVLLLRADSWEYLPENEPVGTAILLDQVSEEQCLAQCLANKDQNGAAFECRSYVRYAFDETCVLRTTVAAPVGDSQLLANPDAIYTEKMCMAASSVLTCPFPPTIERFPQRTLVGFAERSTNVVKLELCVQLCLDAFVNFGFVCRSAMYFYTPNHVGDNCIMNSIDHTTEPDALIEEDVGMVDYFSTADCVAEATTPLPRTFLRRVRSKRPPLGRSSPVPSAQPDYYLGPPPSSPQRRVLQTSRHKPAYKPGHRFRPRRTRRRRTRAKTGVNSVYRVR